MRAHRVFMKTKIRNACLALGLGLVATLGMTGCAWLNPPDTRPGPVTFQPTYSGDKVTPPVYTSPTITSATNSLVTTNGAVSGH